MKMISILLFLISFNINGVDIDFVRTNYTASIKDKQLCSRMISELKKEKEELNSQVAKLKKKEGSIFSRIAKLFK